MSLNYTQLVAAIESYVEDDFSADDIDTIIRQAEDRIYHTVELPALRKNSTGAFTASTPYLTVPVDWLASYSMAVITSTGRYQYLRDRDVNYIREAYPNPNQTGLPTCYAIFDATTLLVGPTPDQAYSVELHYFFRPESITTASTSWLGDNMERVLLAACRLEAYVFMKGEEDLINRYGLEFEDSLAGLKRLGEGKNRQDTYRVVQSRVPVR